MQFGMVGQMGSGMRQIIGFRDWSTGRGNLGLNVGCPIVTNGVFVSYLFKSM